jgi:poly(3-hydroxybutyrate) depolymerase
LALEKGAFAGYSQHTMKRWALAALAAISWQCSTCMVSAVDEAIVRSRTVAEALQRFDAARPRIAAELGADAATDFRHRLFDDLDRQRMQVPESYAPADWAEAVANIVALDIEAVDQLVAGTPAPLRATPGLHEAFVRSRVDGTWQLLAIYVPPGAKPQRAPLAMVLHGNPQTEAELLGPPVLRRLADRTGTILVAPFGRGIYDFAEPAATDVYDLLGTVQDAFAADRGRTYLVGYSMGGFSVFKIGPRGGYRWSGAMCISGAILNSGVRPVSIAWKDMRLYVVTGAHDDSIPTRYGEQTAAYLAGMGLPVSFYEEPRGTHSLRTLVPSLERAWDDMHAALTRPENVPVARAGFALPGAVPGPVAKP